MASDRPTIASVLADPAASFALKAVLLAWSGRDVVDAANDAELLSAILGAEADRFPRGSS
ncbi:hypothetical protein ACETK8_10535 [Brevundimonas staleyi]|jgi:hypothetical protein|uniref:Uncharacterized protein n=2 Tax=Brevundimonas TaxID=41275 RepID=A0A7W9C7Y7_9CAUL|nr:MULTISPECIES: hypothetical protein [Brevundimonas]MBB5740776.1 hypothetical protein [Brevundimonas aurantiaca]MDM8353453.1 hypothetical protein [Brevundimonas diminuta]